jgi:molybdopterin-containing oxidoreductase family membrane subunit
MILVTGWIVIGAYVIEDFTAWYSGSEFEIYQYFVARPFGPGATVFWIQQFCNVVVPQFLWFPAVRRRLWALWIISVLVNVGMWAERFVIIVQSLQRDFLPSAWHSYMPTWVDIGIFTGTIGFFSLLFLVFLRVLPFIPVAEVKELNHELRKDH